MSNCVVPLNSAEEVKRPAVPTRETSFKKHFNVVITWYWLIGMWPEDSFFRFPYVLLTAFMLMVVIWFAVAHGAIILITATTDVMAAVTKSYLSCEFIFCTTIKTYYNLTHMGLVRDLLAKTDRGYFAPRSQRELDILNGPINMWGRLARCYIATILTANCLAWICVGTRSGSRQFILDVWVPCDKDNSTSCFWFWCMCQLFSGVVDTVITFYTALYIVGFLVYAGAQSDLLVYKIRNLYAECETDVKEAVGGELGERYQAMLDVEMRKRFGECLRHHTAILNFMKDLNNITREITFTIYACVILTSCVCLLLSVITRDLLYCAFYLSVAISFWSEVVLICWFGTDLMDKSMKLSEAAYDSKWENCSSVFKKDVLYFMQHTQKPMRLNAIDIIPISLAVGTSILRTSWSYFLVLQQVYGRGDTE